MAMNDCCRATVITELRAQATYLRTTALSYPVGDPFAPGMCSAARALEKDADALERHESVLVDSDD